MRDLEFDIKARDKTGSGFDSARTNARGFNRDLDLTAKGFNIATTAAKGFIAGFTLSAVADFGRAIRGVVADAASIVDMADKVGLTTTALQELRWAAQQSGVEMNALDMGMQRFSRRIAEVAAGANNDLARVLRANNVELRDQDGRLRSQVDILGDYADLIRGAASEQDKLRLAFMAFDSEGAALVNTLRDGKDGLRGLMDSARDAGGVLDSDLLQHAAEIDDEFDKMWRTFELGAKRSILNAVGWLDDLRSSLRQYDEVKNAALLGAEVGRMAGMPPRARGDRLPSVADRRIGEAFAGGQQEPNADMVRLLRDRFGRRTVIPNRNDGDGSTRRSSASAAKDQERAYARVVERLQEERDILGLNSTEQRVVIEQRRAGVTATSDQGKAIADLVRNIEAETERLRKLEEQQRKVDEAVKYLAGNALDSVLAWAQGAATAEDAARGLANEILRAVANAALLGEGPLASLFGGGWGDSGGLVGILFHGASKLFSGAGGVDPWAGLRAGGGQVDPFKTYLVGEKGPELLRMGSRSGQVVSNRDAFGGDGPQSARHAPVNINVSIATPDPQSFAKSKSQIETMLARAVARGNRGL